MLIDSEKANCTLVGIMPDVATLDKIKSAFDVAFGKPKGSNELGTFYRSFPDQIALAKKEGSEGDLAYVIFVSEPGE